MAQRQKGRRQEIFKEFRRRKLELESNKDLEAEQIHEILRREFIDRLNDRWSEEEAEAEGMPTLDDLLEMEREQMYANHPYLYDEGVYEQLNGVDIDVYQGFEELQEGYKQDKTATSGDCAMCETEIGSPYLEKSISKPCCPICSNTINLNGSIITWESDHWINLNLIHQRDDFTLEYFTNAWQDLFEEHNAEVEDEEDGCSKFEPMISVGTIVAQNDSIVINWNNCNFLEFIEL